MELRFPALSLHARLLASLLALTWCRAYCKIRLPTNTTCIQGTDGTRVCRDTARRLDEVDEMKLGGPTDAYKMFVGIDWLIWSGVNDKGGLLDGVLLVETIWPQAADAYLTDAYEVLSVDNFATGSSGILASPVMELQIDGANWWHSTQKFIGTFKQSYDLTCYPFDQLTAKWTLKIHSPGDWVFDLHLLCNGPDYTAYDADGNTVTVSAADLGQNVASCVISSTAGTTASGHVWENLVCTRDSRSTITCQMVGTRVSWKLVQLWILPSVAASLMSFLSFRMDVGKAMPRIATTMIAMLTQINLKLAISKALPTSGSISWMEFFLGQAVMFMLLNLIGHVIIFFLAESKHFRGVDLLNKFFFEKTFCVAGLTPLIRILTSECTEHANLPLIIILILFFLAILAKEVVRDIPHLKEDIPYLLKLVRTFSQGVDREDMAHDARASTQMAAPLQEKKAVDAKDVKSTKTTDKE